MLTFTETARERVLGFMKDFYGEDAALRVGAASGGSPLAPSYELCLVESDDADPGDVVFDAGGFLVYIDAAAAPGIEGAVVDFVGSTFEVRPAAVAAAANPAGDLAERVRRVIEERINPAVAAHGGKIALLGVEDGVAHVQMSGGCQGCGLAAVTLRQGVERMIREAVPEIVAVRDSTDHTSGRRPFFSRRPG